MLSHVWPFVTLWFEAHQPPLSMGFPRQEYWSGLPFFLQGIFPTQGSNPRLLHWQAVSLTLLVSVTMTLFGKKVPADVLKIRMSWGDHLGLGWAPNAMTSVEDKRDGELRHRETQKRGLCGDKGTEGNVAQTKENQEPLEAGKDRKRFSWRGCRAFISDFWAPELWENSYLLF